MPQPDSAKPYYHAADGRVELTRAEDVVAIEEQSLQDAAVPEATWKKVRRKGRQLRAGVWLVPRSALTPESEAALKEAGALQPVFRDHDVLIVVLPEVRVEESRPARRKLLDAWIESHHKKLSVHREGKDRLVLGPLSNDGEDALSVANALMEEVAPELAQARFLRVLPRDV